MIPDYYGIAAQVIPTLTIALFLGPKLIGGPPSSGLILPRGVDSPLGADVDAARGVIVFVILLSEIVSLAVLAGLSEGWLTLVAVFLGLGILLGLVAHVMCRVILADPEGKLSSEQEKITDWTAVTTIVVTWLLLIVPNLPGIRDHL